MDVNDLKLFTRAAELGNITRAAAELGYTQSAASHALRRLEQSLGTQLLQRLHMGVCLTENGRALLPYAAAMLTAQERLIQKAGELSDRVSGTVSVGCISSVAIRWLPELIEHMARRFPAVQIRFQDGSYEDVETWILKKKVDVGFLSAATKQPFRLTPLVEDELLLVGLNALYGAKLSMSELCALGAGIGADVPFALMGGTCRVQGVGDLLKALPPVPDCWFTVVMPDYGVSTPEAFAAYDTVGSSTHPDCEAQEKAIRAGDLDAVCAAAGNALEECSGAKDNEAIKSLLRAHGAVTALMTGSGAAVFGVFRDEAAARAAAAAAKRQWPQVYVAKPDRGGARVIR